MADAARAPVSVTVKSPTKTDAIINAPALNEQSSGHLKICTSSIML